MKIAEYYVKILRTKIISDQLYLKNKFVKKLGYVPNFKHPNSFNEKVNARILFDKSSQYTKLADKWFVRQSVAKKIGEQYLVPIIGCYDKISDIEFNQLPDKFVIKCTHDSGSAIICTNKSSFDFEKAKQKINHHLRKNMHVITREWHYKNIPPRIIIEKYIELFFDKNNVTITTCRVHCFESKVQYIEIDITNEKKIEFTNIYDINWVLQPFKVDNQENISICLPSFIHKVIELSEKLCLTYGYSRIDFLLSQNRIFFSEITLTPNAGRMVIIPLEWDFKLGQLWKVFP